MASGDHDLRGLLRVCSLCGSCNHVCPVFEIESEEPYSPRGRINLFREYLDGNLMENSLVNTVSSTCLLCGNCEASCTRGIGFREILTQTRSLSEYYLSAEYSPCREERIRNRLSRIIKERSTAEKPDYLIFPGSIIGESFPELIEGLTEILRGAGITFTLLPEMNFCQDVLYLSGHLEEFNRAVEINRKWMSRFEFGKILCMSGSDEILFREYYGFSGDRVEGLERFFSNYPGPVFLPELPDSLSMAYHRSLFDLNYPGWDNNITDLLIRNGARAVRLPDLCCGSSLLEGPGLNGIGNVLRENFIGRLDHRGIGKILVSSPACYRQLKKRIPQRVIHLIDIFRP